MSREVSEGDLLIVPKDACWPYYVAWFTERNLSPPAPPSLMLCVASRKLGPVAAVCIYVSDGQFFFLEHLAANPKLPKRLVHQAIKLMAEQAKALGAILCKHPLLSANSRGLVQTLSGAGFSVSRSVPMWAPPIATIQTAEAKKRSDAPGEARVVDGRRAKARKPRRSGATLEVSEANDAGLLAPAPGEGDSSLDEDREIAPYGANEPQPEARPRPRRKPRKVAPRKRDAVA